MGTWGGAGITPQQWDPLWWEQSEPRFVYALSAASGVDSETTAALLGRLGELYEDPADCVVCFIHDHMIPAEAGDEPLWEDA